MKPMLAILILLSLCTLNSSFLPSAPAATIYYVKPTGSDANTGTSWSQAKQGIYAATAVAVSGDQIWVAAGTYSAPVGLKSGIALYGGFAGYEDDLSQRDLAANASILSGPYNLGMVLVSTGADSATRIDGFTLRGTPGTGSGIYCGESSSPIIANCVITGYTADPIGGGIFCDESSSPTITNCVISGNTAFFCAGGIYCQQLSSPTITNCVISQNSAGLYGGGIYSAYSSPTIVNCIISENDASAGGGIDCDQSSSPTITNCTIIGNDAPAGGGICIAGHSSPSFSNNIIAFNSSGIQSYEGMPVLRNNCLYNPGGYDYSGISPGTNDINADPKLEAPEYGRWHLKPDSPCRDAGNNGDTQSGWKDMDNRTRIEDNRVDIGADEFDGTIYTFVPAVVRVRLSGNDANDGSDWPLAKRTVQAAIDAAAAAGGGQVWVAAGTYNERITLKQHVSLYGGFAGSETALSQRNFRAHATILDAQQNGNAVTVATGYRLSRIDGFTVRNGNGIPSDGSRRGGGIYCVFASPTIANCTVTQNGLSIGHGPIGGIFCDSSSPAITNCTISGYNALYCGGIYCASAAPTIVNCTITGNTASRRGGGLYSRYDSSPTLINTILAFNSAGIDDDAEYPGTFLLRNNCLYNPGGNNYTNLSPGPTDLSFDPLFVDRPNGDYHLTAASPCLNAGSDADVDPTWLDLDAQPRVAGLHVDIGADEYYLPGDANGNGAVGFEDFAALQNHYAQSAQTWTTGDFNADAQVTFEDFSILQNHYGQITGTAPSLSPAAASDPFPSSLPCAASALAVFLTAAFAARFSPHRPPSP